MPQPLRRRDGVNCALPCACHSDGCSCGVYVGELAERIDEVDSARPVTTFCCSGQRAIVGAALLKKHNADQVEVCLGSMQACQAVSCEVLSGEAP